jgi:hypothetical protein
VDKRQDQQLVTTTLDRLGKLKQIRSPWESLWQDCTDMVNPRRGDFNVSRSQGDRSRYDRVYDSTAPLANEQLAAGLHGYLTAPSETWFNLILERMGAKEASDQVIEYLQEVVEIMFRDVFHSPNSNFGSMIHELYLDLGSYGTGVMYIEDRPGKPINFRTYHLAECFVAESAEGTVDTLYRQYKHTGRQLVQLYKDVLPEKFIENVYKDPHKEYTCIHAVEPRDSFNPSSKLAKDMPWMSAYVLEEEKLVLSLGGFNEFPYMVPRWTKTAGEVYGRSPAMTAMPDIKMVNEMSKTVIKAAQKATDPPLLVPDDGFMLPLRTIPGGLNYYRSGTQDTVKPLVEGIRPDIGLEFIDSRRQHILKTFHVDWMQMREGPSMTATEVLQRQEERMRLMGPMVGRLQFELLGPMIDRVFNILARRKMLPQPPQDVEGRTLRIDYVSPVARAQKTQQLFNFTRLLESIVPLANVKPDVFDNIDADGTVRWAAKLLDVPTATLTKEEDVKASREDRANQQAQAAEVAKGRELAATAKDAANAAASMPAGAMEQPPEQGVEGGGLPV